ncbi:MAG: hypothetical protein NTZ33_09135 [Bacteroidetes bacterium]|nr:hypothetical protein [Bacteroidota bacterium]
MFWKITIAEVVITNDIILYITIFFVLIAIFGAFKLLQLIKKIRKQKDDLHKLVKDYENFLKEKEKK